MGTRSYEQFCPVARTLDLIGDRWALLVVRQLLIEPHRFSDLQERLGGVSPTVLRDRLRELESHGICRRAELAPPAARTVYELTARGRELEPVLYELGRWGLPLLDAPSRDQPLLPYLVRPGLKTLVCTEALPDSTLTVDLALVEGRCTLRVEPPPADSGATRREIDRVRVEDPTCDTTPDARLETSMPALLLLRRGDLAYTDAQTQGMAELTGDLGAAAMTAALFGFELDQTAEVGV